MINCFGSKIKMLRKGKRYTQAQMAEILGVHLQTISRYERGELTPSPDILSVLAEKFNVDVNWLFSDNDVVISRDLGVNYEPENKSKVIGAADQFPFKHYPETAKKIIRVLPRLSEADLDAVLKYVGEKRLLAELKEERQKKQG